MVSIYQLITDGTFIQKIHESALVLMALVFVLAILFGPVFCGWFCPFGSFQEWLGKLGRKAFGKRFNHMVPPKSDRVLRYLRYGVLGMVVYMTAKTGLLVFQNVDPYYALFNFFSGEVAIPALIALVAVVVLSLVVERPFCKYACPYGALIGLTNLFRVFGIRRRPSSCIGCKACDRACPMNIPVSESGTVRNPQCISCMKCTSESACPIPDTVTLPHQRRRNKCESRHGRWHPSRSWWSSNLIEICQRPEGCNLTVTVLGSQLSGICLDHRIAKGSVHLAK